MAEEKAEPISSKSENPIDILYTGVAENTFQDSSMVSETQFKPFNPDDLVQKDQTYAIYDEMVNDDQVSVALQMKKDLVLNSGWDINCQDEEIKEFFENVLENDTECSFSDQLMEVLTAYEYGFSISEKIFKVRDDGMLTLKRIKTRHPGSWRIETDEKGNISALKQYGRSSEVTVEQNSVIHYVNNSRFQNPYGKSDLRSAYAAWFTKRQIIKYYAIYLEKNASPIPVARYDKNAPKSAVDKIFAVIKKFQQKTAIAIPKEIEVEFLESKNNVGDAYIRGINLFNMFIGRSMFVPDLMGMSGSETNGGSFALGSEQFKLYAKHIDKRRKEIEAIVNKHIIRPIVLYNFGDVENFPEFKLRPIETDDAHKMATLWLEAVKGKAYVPSDEEINHFRSIVKFPEGEVIRVSEPPPINQPPMDDEPPTDVDDETEIEIELEAKNTPPTIANDDMEKMKSFAYDMPSGNYYKKVDFKKMETSLDNTVNKITSDGKRVVDFIIEDVIEQIRKKRIIETGNLDKLDSIKIKKLKELNTIIRKDLKQQYLDGKRIAQTEIFKSQFAEPVVDEKFLEILDREIFEYIGKYEYAVSEKVKLRLIAAIKDGLPLSSVEGVLRNDLEKLSETSLERFSRTKSTEVFNKGRINFFKDSKVVSGYQYSAVLDGQTTEICRGLHGKKFVAGTEPIPPMHFNCRSVLIPITVFEEFEPTENITVSKETEEPIKNKSDNTKDIDVNAFIDLWKGDGFSTK